jgi:hypothetical protein
MNSKKRQPSTGTRYVSSQERKMNHFCKFHLCNVTTNIPSSRRGLFSHLLFQLTWIKHHFLTLSHGSVCPSSNLST